MLPMKRHLNLIVTAVLASNITWLLFKVCYDSKIAELESKIAHMEGVDIGYVDRNGRESSSMSDRSIGSDPVVVAMCLSDATTGQLEEIQVALKSMIYQSPPAGNRYSALDIYFIASDDISFRMLNEMLEEGKLDGSLWPIPISITVVDVSRLTDRFLWKVVRGPVLKRFWIMHHVGAFWRLMLPWILPDKITHLIYIDTDAWFRDNIVGMWLERDFTSMIQWTTEARTSGVVILNLPMMKTRMWKAWGAAACAGFRENRNRTDKHKDEPYFVRPHISASTGDQAFFQCLAEYFPDLEGGLSPPYGMLHYAMAYKWGKQWTDKFEGGAVLHHNGGGKQNKIAYWRMFLPNRTVELEGTLTPPHKNDRVWRTATFFADLPWHWLLFHGKVYNRILEVAGYPLVVKASIVPEDYLPFKESVKEAYSAWDRALELTNKTSEDCRQILLE